jgi:hypothetical protein
MRVAIVAVLLALAGCANYRISGSTGTAVASGGSGAYVATTSTSGALFFALMFGAMASSQEASVEAAPAMSAARSINEQDCTRPVSLTGGGNLRCR